MTEKARQLGMRQTNYHNASGLPDNLQITTASDLSILARRLGTDFPQYWSYFSLAGFNYKGVYYPTHDNLIGRYQGADGIKTGYTGASGFNLASSVERDGVHLIGIVMGGRTAVRRDLEMMHILDTEFAQIGLNPALVAHNAVAPGAAFAAVTPAPATYNDQIAALSANPAPLPVTDDEEAAETLRAPDEAFAVIHAETPAKAQQQAAAPKPAKPVPGQRPAGRTVAAATPTARPLISPPVATSPMGIKGEPAVPPLQVATQTPQLRPQIGEGDIDQPGTPVPGRNWVIQIGAYADQALAKAQLASYAQRAQDVLGRAAKIVAPIKGSNGHMLYRARFGLFAERDARQVCDRLTQRGQTCFAAIATR
jgi:D-alanyl-D-alanine carboxypeptidase